MTQHAPVQFYYPGAADPDHIPEAHGVYVAGRAGQYIWVVKTYGLLRAQGYDCILTRTMPDRGIIITHRDFLPDHLQPNPCQTFICAVADTWLHPYAQINILQNAAHPLLMQPDSAWRTVYLPHWTETGLQPRDPGRGAALVNIGYFGQLDRFAPQLVQEKFRARLASLGMQLQIVATDRWNDYRAIDVVLAVRSFAVLPFYRHPPSKLFNSWVAGVPALLGQEKAYQAERRSPLDFVEVDSVDAIIAALRRLRDDPDWRSAMVQQGAVRAQEVAVPRIAARWIDMLETVARPVMAAWQVTATDAAQRAAYFARRQAAYRRYRAEDWITRAYALLRKKLASR